MTSYGPARVIKARIGDKVYHLPKDLWSRCKEEYVTPSDIEKEMRRFKMLGVDATYTTAAAAALKEKTRVRWN